MTVFELIFLGVAHNFIGHSEDIVNYYEHSVPSKHWRKQSKTENQTHAVSIPHSLLLMRRRKKDFVNDYFMICALEDAPCLDTAFVTSGGTVSDRFSLCHAIIFLVPHQCPKEDAPAHSGEIVTVRSLCEAFATSKMTKAGTM